MIGCTVCGHRDVDYSEYKDNLIKVLKDIIDMYHDVRFYLGGYGAFDNMCADVLYSIKRYYNEYAKPYKIILRLVVPYEHQYNYRCTHKGIYDEVLYPLGLELDKYHAIVNRNYYMVDNANIVISGVIRKYGGAYKTLCYANQENKTIFNICHDIYYK